MTQGEVREMVWTALARHHAATYPLPPHGHHPNFVGASRAAERLMRLPLWHKAQVVLAGLDQVLKPLREAAMKSGKTVLIPHPDRAGRYLSLKGLPPQQLKRIREAAWLGRPVELEHIPIDLVLVGSVAVDEKLGWLGKGYGFPPKNLRVAAPWATLAHTLMVFEALPCEPEGKVDLIATPHQVISI
ncbi:5-formyltetrahydrofolate cyclo-ligase family protein [Meiothermus luteus]|jgi:5-formyltetrahydrofolate cyclo-ligase|uniref:5-formyltetrahydrofolate cyclo-ligase family protein n=1 Tax=Meiothermus luteus TaxID=2026184 RepID=A0A399E9X5_9DEIN|nr:5-formyltetrahydrofolate cyclo-ligase [Meiothermus luteus]RIH81165.1 5-formyltetrahydrofolate cyclo-ligase family protein [Meiothermus luteus]RMH55539.1 MAG: 5-formyltetrahydrofolate cyclo-ligase [Deinococcota bacterium]